MDIVENTWRLLESPLPDDEVILLIRHRIVKLMKQTGYDYLAFVDEREFLEMQQLPEGRPKWNKPIEPVRLNLLGLLASSELIPANVTTAHIPFAKLRSACKSGESFHLKNLSLLDGAYLRLLGIDVKLADKESNTFLINPQRKAMERSIREVSTAVRSINLIDSENPKDQGKDFGDYFTQINIT